MQYAIYIKESDKIYLRKIKADSHEIDKAGCLNLYIQILTDKEILAATDILISVGTTSDKHYGFSLIRCYSPHYWMEFYCV